MKRNNLTIVGGGSTYTLTMVLSLIDEKINFPLKKVVLYDINEKRQAKVGQVCEIVLKEKYPEIKEFIYTTNKEEAFKNADYVFMQIRTGGLALREKDEQIPLKYGLVGQETCGAGGFAYGLRSIKDIIQLVKDIRLFAPDAWIFNYSNPAAIVAEATKRAFPADKKILNICDMPFIILHSYASLIGEDFWNLVPEYFGLNHFGWFTKIKNKKGEDLTQKIKDAVLSGDFRPKAVEIAEDKSWQDTFKQAKKMLEDFPEYLPNTYMQYYLYPEYKVSHEDINNTRARQVINGREKETFNLCDKIISAGTVKNMELEGNVHGSYMIRVASSILNNSNEVYLVIVKNNGIIENLEDDVMVEIPAQITNEGPKPFAVGKISTFYKGMIETQNAFEKLTVDAFFENSYQKALEALCLNRTIINAPVAKKVLDEFIEVNKGYFPKLKK